MKELNLNLTKKRKENPPQKNVPTQFSIQKNTPSTKISTFSFFQNQFFLNHLDCAEH